MKPDSRLMTATGLKVWLRTASPNEVVDALEEMTGEGSATDEEEHPKGCRCDDCKEEEKAAKDEAEVFSPEKLSASEFAVVDAAPSVPIFTFFNGKPYAQGLADYVAHLKGAK